MPTAVQSPRRVLFVDDDARFLEITKELMTELSRGQWEISTAQSASKAFAVLQEHPIDLAVIDVQMGVMDGIQMLALLNRGYPNVQKVVLTGFANEKYRAACLSNGAELFLEKPTSQDGWQILFTALNEVVRFKPEEGFRGVLRRVGIQDVLQMECLARSSSVLEISDAKLNGKIFVDVGQIVHAQVGDLTGEAAFNRLMGLSGGHFNLKPFVEPPARSISGAWEFLLMEAARKRDEADSEAVTSTVSTEPPATISGETDVSMEPGLTPETITAPTAALGAAAEFRPVVEEMLVCSAQGEVLNQWQCRNIDLWVNFFEFVSKRSQRLAQSLPLGEFDRLVIQAEDVRAVVIIGLDRGVLVKTRKEPATV
jgi:CheY-like chemotaxis protein